MYIPASFNVRDTKRIVQYIREYGFGLLITAAGSEITATHVPFVIHEHDDGRIVLRTHLARANSQWNDLCGQAALVVFQGPHAYISPRWYVEHKDVPTWNYVAVHAYGTCRIIDDGDELHALLRTVVQNYEPTSPLLSQLDQTFYRSMERAVVGIEIEVSSLEGKEKLSQNKSRETRAGIIDGLLASGSFMSQEIAGLMKKQLEESSSPSQSNKER